MLYYTLKLNLISHNFMNILLLLFILVLVSVKASEQPGCVNAIGQPVAWWVILKVPPMIGVSGYAYYDSNSLSGQFEYVNKSVDLTVSPLTQTLGQINHDQLERIAWNDEKPNNQTSSSKAHSKGIIAYSKLSSRGFYIVHSIPKYPAFLQNHSINMTIPNSEQIYGQHIGCFSLSLYQLNNIAEHLLMIHPFVYEAQVTLRAGTQNLYDMANGNLPVVKELFQYYAMRPAGYTMQAIFKNNNVNGSIFEDGVAKWLKPGKVAAETWGRPLQAPWCSEGFEVLNVQQIQLTPQIKWTQSEDHSKWMITGEKYSCFGDMNRMESQWKRGGAFYCLDDPSLNTAMRKIIIATDQCKKSSNWLSLLKQKYNIRKE